MSDCICCYAKPAHNLLTSIKILPLNVIIPLHKSSNVVSYTKLLLLLSLFMHWSRMFILTWRQLVVRHRLFWWYAITAWRPIVLILVGLWFGAFRRGDLTDCVSEWCTKQWSESSDAEHFAVWFNWSGWKATVVEKVPKYEYEQDVVCASCMEGDMMSILHQPHLSRWIRCETRCKREGTWIRIGDYAVASRRTKLGEPYFTRVCHWLLNRHNRQGEAMFRSLVKTPSLSTSILRTNINQNPLTSAPATTFTNLFTFPIQLLTRRWKGTYGREYQVRLLALVMNSWLIMVAQ